MRLPDLARLALEALWQRRLRTALTAVGVAVGSFVLVATLSVGLGVQEVILEQIRKQDTLRRIVVWSEGKPPPSKEPASAAEVRGEMSDARRERLREAFRRRERPSGLTAVRLVTPENRAALQRLAHVESVVPSVFLFGTAERDGRGVNGDIRTAAPNDLGVERRLVAGRGFAPGERAAMVSEYLAYRWGLEDEDSVEKVLGEPVRLTLPRQRGGPANLMVLLGAYRPELSDEERKTLEGAVRRLPAALPLLGLPEKERRVLEKVLGEPTKKPDQAAATRLPVVGVYRDVTKTELAPWDILPRPVDVIVSPNVADDLRVRAAPLRKADQGVQQVVVRVDHEDHLRAVQEEIKALGLETFSLVEVVDQVRLNVLLIAIASTFVGLLALAVAAMGITNTMLMSVLERTHEIGVMKATGARDGQVLGMFLLEGTLIGVAGSAAGLLAGWLLSFPGDHVAQRIIAAQTHMQIERSVYLFPLWLLTGVPAVVCLLTTLAAVYPARRAARIDPIVALRQR